MPDEHDDIPEFHIRRHGERQILQGGSEAETDTGEEPVAPVEAGDAAAEDARGTKRRHRGKERTNESSKKPTKRGKLKESALGDGYYSEVAGRRQNAVSKIIGNWVDRLMGAASKRSFAGQEAQYESGRTTRDYICNTVGGTLWGIVFPLLTIVVTQLSGANQAGVFSLAFVTATLLMYIGNYGVRTFQVSDTSEEHSFADYQANRVITCVLMLVIGLLYCHVRGYTGEMLVVSIAVYVYRMVDGMADVYEGRLQQADKMYLAGVSQAIRSGLVFIVFTAVLFLSRNLSAASISMSIAAVFTFIVVTAPLAYMETPKSRKMRLSNVIDLLQRCFPLFVALFLYNLIDNMPKFLMEGVVSYDNQLYFNALYFPAQSIMLIVGMVYKPLLLRLANAWIDPEGNRQFRMILGAVFACIIGVTVLMLLLMGTIGIPIMSLLYGLDFEQFRVLLYLMIVTGGITASIDFLYQVITVQRKQNSVMKLYVVTFLVSLVACFVLIHWLGLLGAVIAYLVEMSVLLLLIIAQLTNLRYRMGIRSRTRMANGVGQDFGY